MRNYRTRFAARALALAWVASLIPGQALAGLEGGKQANLAQATKRTLLAFPFDVPETSVPGAGDVSTLLSDVARSRLIASGAYTVAEFHKGMPTVARLHNDQQLTDSDLMKPFAEDNAKATKITKLVGYEVAFVGSVDDYQYNATDKQSTATVSGRLLDMANGKIIKSATLSASSAKGGTAKEPEKALEAARNAGEKLMAQLVPTVIVNPVEPIKKGKTPPPSSNGKRSRSSSWIWGLLAVGLGLGIGLASGGGGGSGGGGADLPPPPPR